MSQEALAARAGYERAFISLLELGKSNPSLRSIFDICSALGVRPAKFLRQVERLSNFELPQEPGQLSPDTTLRVISSRDDQHKRSDRRLP